MSAIQQISRTLVALVTLLSGCSGSDQLGAPGRDSVATVDVAGLTIEAEPLGKDGGVSIGSEEDGPSHQDENGSVPSAVFQDQGS